MEDKRTHIIHERTEQVRRTLGYRVVSTKNNCVSVIVAEARCHPNDNFNRKVARNIVNTRLTSAMEDGHRYRVFNASIDGIREPKTASEWRELEQTLLMLSEYRLPIPAALQS